MNLIGHNKPMHVSAKIRVYKRVKLKDAPTMAQPLQSKILGGAYYLFATNSLCKICTGGKLGPKIYVHRTCVHAHS